MSEEFIQGRIYFEEIGNDGKIINGRLCIDGDIEKLPKDVVRCIIVPINDKDFKQSLVECWCNLGKQIVDGLSMAERKNENNDWMTKDGILKDLATRLRKLTTTLQYLVNSTSWQDQRIYEFDRDEINKRLEDVML